LRSNAAALTAKLFGIDEDHARQVAQGRKKEREYRRRRAYWKMGEVVPPGCARGALRQESIFDCSIGFKPVILLFNNLKREGRQSLVLEEEGAGGTERSLFVP